MRIQITVSKELFEELEHVSADYGITRSALCSMWLNDHLLSYKAKRLFASKGVKNDD